VAADGYLWVGNDAAGSTTIRRVDPTTWEVTEVETGGSRPAWLAVTPGVVWAAQMSSGTMVGIDTSTLAPIGLPAAAGFSPVNLEATPDGRWVWVPDDYDNFLTRVDAATGDAVERLKVGLGPAVVSASNDEVWVTNFAEGSVWRLALGR
jgi:DNA-binding beta-propeller fold protein YncE